MAGKLCNAIVGFDDDIISFWNDVIALRYAMIVRGTPTSTNHCTHLQESYVERLDKDVTERKTCCVVDDDLWCTIKVFVQVFTVNSFVKYETEVMIPFAVNRLAW